MIQEIWLSIPGHVGMYEVSNLGEIRSLNRVVIGKGGSTYIRCGKVLKKILNSNGYYVIGLCINGKSKMCKVHRLVAQVFLPNLNDHPQVNHIDGNKTNNIVSNLEWCTNAENTQHAYNSGLKFGSVGSKNGNSKLNEIDVETINIRLANGESARSLAKIYGVHHSLLSLIKQRKIWSHVPRYLEV